MITVRETLRILESFTVLTEVGWRDSAVNSNVRAMQAWGFQFDSQKLWCSLAGWPGLLNELSDCLKTWSRRCWRNNIWGWPLVCTPLCTHHTSPQACSYNTRIMLPHTNARHKGGIVTEIPLPDKKVQDAFGLWDDLVRLAQGVRREASKRPGVSHCWVSSTIHREKPMPTLGLTSSCDRYLVKVYFPSSFVKPKWRFLWDRMKRWKITRHQSHLTPRKFCLQMETILRCDIVLPVAAMHTGVFPTGVKS